jgi:acyl carrier protein
MVLYSHETQLRDFLSTRFALDMSDTPLDEPLVETLALDSLAGLELMVEIEVQFNVYFTEDHLAQDRTLRNILEALDGLSWRAAS